MLRLRTWWETADRTQKVVTIFGSAFLAFLLLGTFYFATRPKMALAYGGLGPADMGRVVAEIQKLGIEVEYDLQGNVRVPSDKVAEVQALLARNGAGPTTGHLGAKDLGSISMTTPKSVEEAQLVAVREGEIAKAIESLAGVESARVLLNPGRKGGFADEDEPPTASVTVGERPGADLGPEQAKAIASLVSRSVPGLTLKNVSVVSREGITLFDGGDQESFLGKFATKGEAQANEAKRIKRELQPMLDRAFGPGNTLLTARVEMDFDETRENRDEIKPHADPIQVAKAKETMTAGVTIPAGGIAGVAANTGAPATPSLEAGNPSYQGTKDEVVYPWDKISTQKTKAPGTVTSLAITVLADSKAVKDVAAVENLLKGYLGPKFNAQDPNFSVTVTATEFDRSLDKVAKDAAAAIAGRERMQQIFALIPIAALILVGFFVVRSLGKVAKTSNVLVSALPDGTLVAPDGSAPIPGGSGGTPAEMRALQAARASKEPVEVGEIQEKLDVPLEQIKKLAKDRPNTVAMLIKSWMLEETR